MILPQFGRSNQNKKKLFWNQHTIRFDIGGVYKCIFFSYTKSDFSETLCKKVLKKWLQKYIFNLLHPLSWTFCYAGFKTVFFFFFWLFLKNCVGAALWKIYLRCHKSNLAIWTSALAIKRAFIGCFKGAKCLKPIFWVNMWHYDHILKSSNT